MADYPSIPLEWDSAAEPMNGHETDLAEDGTFRSRLFFEHQPYDFTIRHSYIPYTDIETLQDFYADNRLSTIQLTWKDGQTYDCRFTAPPKFDRIRGQWWQAELKLIGSLAA